MIVEYIRYKVAEAQRAAFEAAYEKALPSLQASSHCLGYELSRCVEESGCYILRIEWDSLDGHLKGFRASPEFQSFFAHVRPFVNNIEEMRHYEVMTIKGEK